MRALFTQALVQSLSFEKMPVRIHGRNAIVSEPNVRMMAYVIYDSHREAPVGFGVKVSSKTKIYFVQRRINSRVVKIKVGHVNDFDSPMLARDYGRRLVQKVIEGDLVANNGEKTKDLLDKAMLEIHLIKTSLINLPVPVSKNTGRSIEEELRKIRVRSEIDNLGDGVALNSKMAAIYLGVCDKTLARMRRAGIGPKYFRYDLIKCAANKKIFYRLGDIRKYQADALRLS
jgi:hypothetical protein